METTACQLFVCKTSRNVLLQLILDWSLRVRTMRHGVLPVQR